MCMCVCSLHAAVYTYLIHWLAKINGLTGHCFSTLPTISQAVAIYPQMTFSPRTIARQHLFVQGAVEIEEQPEPMGECPRRFTFPSAFRVVGVKRCQVANQFIPVHRSTFCGVSNIQLAEPLLASGTRQLTRQLITTPCSILTTIRIFHCLRVSADTEWSRPHAAPPGVRSEIWA